MKNFPAIFILMAVTLPAWAGEPLKGGFQASEAKDMIALSIDLNGTGLGDKPDPTEWGCGPGKPSPVAGWECLFDGKGDGEKMGIKPYNNRWKLWKKSDADKTYALAIRGTIGNFESIVEDLLATSLPGKDVQINDKARHRFIRFNLANTAQAEVHMGFTYALAVVMFHRSRGILNQLAKLPEGSRLYITGHSQGAAMAGQSHEGSA